MTTDTDRSIRYRGHLSLCEVDITGQQRLRDATVAVVGCGGLASPCLQYLAAAGVGCIRLIDADRVELSNLQRQIIHTTADLGRPKTSSAADRIRALNPDVRVGEAQTFLTPDNARGLLKGSDVVVDCTDSYAVKRLISKTCAKASLPLSIGAVSRFSGMAMTQFPGSPCYACVFPEERDDARETSCAAAGIFNGVVGLIGVIQACEVMKIIMKTGDTLAGRLLTVDALTMEFNTLTIHRDPACPVCGATDPSLPR